jgi:hypothetical protein
MSRPSSYREAELMRLADGEALNTTERTADAMKSKRGIFDADGDLAGYVRPDGDKWQALDSGETPIGIFGTMLDAVRKFHDAHRDPHRREALRLAEPARKWG